jgi:TPR repeat protein
MLNHDLPEEYAFISYSHVQKAFADTLKQFLEENIDEAIRWYGKAAEQDYPGAAQRLAALGAAGSSV